MTPQSSIPAEAPEIKVPLWLWDRLVSTHRGLVAGVEDLFRHGSKTKQVYNLKQDLLRATLVEPHLVALEEKLVAPKPEPTPPTELKPSLATLTLNDDFRFEFDFAQQQLTATFGEYRIEITEIKNTEIRDGLAQNLRNAGQREIRFDYVILRVADFARPFFDLVSHKFVVVAYISPEDLQRLILWIEQLPIEES